MRDIIPLFFISTIRSVASISPRAASDAAVFNSSSPSNSRTTSDPSFPVWGYAAIVAGALLLSGGAWAIFRLFATNPSSGRTIEELTRERDELLREAARMLPLLDEFKRQNQDIVRGLEHSGDPRYIPTDETPHEFICPITGQIMRQPVEIERGRSYEYSAIMRWYSLGHTQSPVTREPLRNPREIGINTELRTRITEHVLRIDTVPPVAEEASESSSTSTLRR